MMSLHCDNDYDMYDMMWHCTSLLLLLLTLRGFPADCCAAPVLPLLSLSLTLRSHLPRTPGLLTAGRTTTPVSLPAFPHILPSSSSPPLYQPAQQLKTFFLIFLKSQTRKVIADALELLQCCWLKLTLCVVSWQPGSWERERHTSRPH